MAELELVRVDQDGRVLVLRAPDGTEHTLSVTDALTDALARPGSGTTADPSAGSGAADAQEPATGGPSRPRPTPVPSSADPSGATPPSAAPQEPTLRPRDLQARLRAGATAEELATQAGLPVENVRRYEWPVIAERDHVIAMVRAHEVPGLDGTAELGVIADARLAARGVTPPDAAWSARREGTAPWVVEVRFWAGDRERSARWTFDQRGRLVTPLDDEARWLGQPDEPLTPQIRPVPARPVPTHPVPALGPRRAPSPSSAAGSRGSGTWNDRDETDVLLDDLAGRRGHRTRNAEARPATAPLPLGSAHHPAAGEDDGYPVIPLGDVHLPGHRREPAAEAESAHSASVVDIGRWNPRRPRDTSVSPGGGPDGTQPALFTASGDEPHAPEPRTPHSRAPQPAAPQPAAPQPAAPLSRPAQEPHDDAAQDGEPNPVDERPAASADRPQAPARGGAAARRKGRAQVPSWDEIVFGARPEPG